MLRWFLISTEDGKVVYNYESENKNGALVDALLIEAFIEAIQPFSDSADSPQQIQFSNLMFYTKRYDSFTLQFVFDEKVEEGELIGLFDLVATETHQLLAIDDDQNQILSSKETFNDKLNQ